MTFGTLIIQLMLGVILSYIIICECDLKRSFKNYILVFVITNVLVFCILGGVDFLIDHTKDIHTFLNTQIF